MTSYGVIVPATRARTILAAAGVTRTDDLGPDGLEFLYNGVTFWILQRGVIFPPSETSADGAHIVYAPSVEELALANPPETPLDTLERYLGIASKVMLAGAVILGVLFLSRFWGR